MPYLVPLFVMGMLVAVVVGLVGVMRVLRKRREGRRDLLMGLRCMCGYALAGLEVPRCPDCGRMIGFDKTAEELGLSEAEMDAHVARKKATGGRLTR